MRPHVLYQSFRRGHSSAKILAELPTTTLDRAAGLCNPAAIGTHPGQIVPTTLYCVDNLALLTLKSQVCHNHRGNFRRFNGNSPHSAMLAPNLSLSQETQRSGGSSINAACSRSDNICSSQ